MPKFGGARLLEAVCSPLLPRDLVASESCCPQSPSLGIPFAGGPLLSEQATSHRYPAGVNDGEPPNLACKRVCHLTEPLLPLLRHGPLPHRCCQGSPSGEQSTTSATVPRLQGERREEQGQDADGDKQRLDPQGVVRQRPEPGASPSGRHAGMGQRAAAFRARP